MIFETHTLILDQFSLKNKTTFRNAPVRYTIYGNLKNEKKLALFFHAFSSNSELHTWWSKFPLQQVLNQFNIICINTLGSCYGSLGPETIDSNSDHTYANTFPQITIEDSVNFIMLALDNLGIKKLDLVFGCSLGGMQTLDMFFRYHHRADKFIAVCASRLPLSVTLWNSAQINIIQEAIKRELPDSEIRIRMGLARFFFRLSCTSEAGLIKLSDHLDLSSNLSHSLEKYFIKNGKDFESTFSPYSYCLLLRMLSDFESPIQLKSIEKKTAKITLVSIQDDQFTPPEQISSIYKILIENQFNAEIKHFKTDYGHESWIIDAENFYEFIKTDLYS